MSVAFPPHPPLTSKSVRGTIRMVSLDRSSIRRRWRLHTVEKHERGKIWWRGVSTGV